MLEEQGSGKPYAEAWRASRRYVGWGLLWAVVLLLAGKALDLLAHQLAWSEGIRFWLVSPLTSLAEHLGAGFFVSAIAVYFYEWGAHAKKLIDVFVKSQRELEKQEAITNAQSREALQRGLQDLLAVEDSKPHHREVANILYDLVHATAGLCRSQSLADERYVKVVTSMLKEAQQNADALRTLDEADENSFIISSASVLADTILASQMSGMGRGDMYNVVSDFASWQRGQLAGFREETRQAVERGAKIRRIFNLLHEGACNIGEAEIRKILMAHLRDVEESADLKAGTYQVACFGERELRNLPEQYHYDARREHYGVFAQDGKITRFEVRELDLSRMVLSRKERILRRDRDLFEAMWKVAHVYEPSPGSKGRDREEERERFVQYVESEVRSRR